MHKTNSTRRVLTPLLLLLCLAGCASESTRYLQVTPPAIPPLPAAARQTPTLTPCLPSCSAALKSDLERWLKTSTPPEQPDSPAKPVMTP